MVTRIQKWGNSLGLRLPKALADQTGISEGTAVDVTVEGGLIVVRPTTTYALADLLNAITHDNRHDVVDWGEPLGRESW